jgi:hypothetical protein
MGFLKKQSSVIDQASSPQFPGGEAMIPPLEDTAGGVLVVDKCIHCLGRRRIMAAMSSGTLFFESSEGLAMPPDVNMELPDSIW